MLLTDASRLHGMGYALIQKDSDGKIRLVNCNSTSFSSTQRNYATIELEALAIKWAIEKCSYYLRGMPEFVVMTDHKPLIGIFKKPLYEISNTRIESYRVKLVDYNFRIDWCPGKDHLVADALSRAPVFQEDDQATITEEENVALCFKVAEDPALQSLYDDAEEDDTYTRIIEAWKKNENPKTNQVLIPYAGVWEQISLFDDSLLVLDGQRIVVPRNAQKRILKLLHIPHAGINKTKMNAKRFYYWPGMNNDIKQIVGNCHVCQEKLPSQRREPLVQTFAKGPMDYVDVDLHECQGTNWLVMVDRYSSFPIAQETKGKTTDEVVKVLLSWFNDWGYPKCLRSDNGPAFREKFNLFCHENGIKSDKSSPYNSQSNGLAESGVKNVKYLLDKCLQTGEDYKTALHEWRNCPRTNGTSPSEAFLGRQVRGKLPHIGLSKFNGERFQEVRRKENENVKERYDSKAYELPPLQIGNKVRIQDPVSKEWTKIGTIVSIHENGRSYELLTEEGKECRRNRRFIRLNTALSSVTKDLSTEQDDLIKPILRRSPRLEKKRVSFEVSYNGESRVKREG
jgi:hypothetical protein